MQSVSPVLFSAIERHRPGIRRSSAAVLENPYSQGDTLDVWLTGKHRRSYMDLIEGDGSTRGPEYLKQLAQQVFPKPEASGGSGII